MNRFEALVRLARVHTCALTLLPLLVASTARAQVVTGPASDLLTTPAGGTTMDSAFDASMGGVPIPPGFFGPGSDPFNGTITVHGLPLQGTPSSAPSGVGITAQADTIVRRLAPASVGPCPSAAGVPIEIVALSLVSVQPITVTFGGGTSTTTWQVMVCLSSTSTQPIGTMQIQHNNVNGGTFITSLGVVPRLIFTRCSGTAGLPQVVMDPAPSVSLSTQGVWSYTPLGLDILSSPGGTVDHDCNTATPPVPYPPSSNFFPGVSAPGATCMLPGLAPVKMMTAEQAMLAAHGVMPPCRPPGVGFCFGDGSGMACPCGNTGSPGHGCNISLGTGGGILFGSGEAKVSGDTLTLRIEDVGEGTPVLLFQGTVGIAGIVFGDGLRCVQGNIRRFPIQFARCGKVNFGSPVGTARISAVGAVPPGGGNFFYQGWFRNAPPFCTPATFNLTNGYTVTWMP